MDTIFILLLSTSAVLTNNVGPPVIKEHPASMVARRNDPATLNCAATGASRIRWFRDGEEVTTASEDPQSHRILLPSGSLFFLRVASSRRGGDAGIYWCVASNSYGATRSNNATLTVASLGHEFLHHPKPLVKAEVGATIRLSCKAPKGSPKPHITWIKNGKRVTNSSRVMASIVGDLIIDKAEQMDSGSYVCKAQNIVGTRETKPTIVTILIPPWFRERPSNVTTASGAKVEFICDVQGYPKPFLTWRRLDGKVPFGRTTRTEDQHLIIEEVNSQDSGVYVCEAENEAGVAIAEARLVVVAAPVVTQRPHDKNIMTGETATLTCKIQGTPSPFVFWRLHQSKNNEILASGQRKGSVSVSEDGSIMKIQKTLPKDSGTYSCWGISSGGGISSNAEIQVVDANPPPLIGVGPQDLNVAPGTTATLPCEPVSEASPPIVTWWYQSSDLAEALQVIENTRVKLSENGALIIKNVDQTDGGIYTCHITADTGTIEQAAILQVDKLSKKRKQARFLPAPPSKPKVNPINETSAHLTWLPNSQISQGIKLSYIVEYWRKGWDEWRVANARIVGESCTISDLSHSVSYTFLVRAVTNQGPSFPSPWSDPFTPHHPIDPEISVEEINLARRRLSRPTVTLSSVTSSSPESVILAWEPVNHLGNYMDGVILYTVDPGKNIQETSILSSTSTSHTLRGLSPYTEYTFFVVPFWKIVEGTPSNSKTLKTPEDVPLISPSNVIATLHNEGSVLITWSPLTQSEAQGKIMGYEVLITHQKSQTSETVQTPWLEVHGLELGGLYTVRVAAMTSVGFGPYSTPILVDVPSESEDFHEETDTSDKPTSVLYSPTEPVWILYILVPLVILISLITLLYVHRLRFKESNTPHGPSLYQDPSLYSAPHSVNMYGEQKIWRPTEVESHGSIVSTKLIQASQLKNEYAEPKLQYPNEIAEPYATTALLTSSPRHLNSHHWSQGSDDSGVQVNWAAIIPPPPSCPPPVDRDLGEPRGYSEPECLLYKGFLHSSLYNQTGNSEQHYEWPCNTNSDVTQGVYTDVMNSKGNPNMFFTFNTLKHGGYNKTDSDFDYKNCKDYKNNIK